MKLKEILNIPGMGGLYKTVAKTKNGFIVESLVDGKRQSITQTHKVSMLGDISVFTTDDSLPLSEVFKKMDGDSSEKADAKSDAATLRKYFKKIIPDMDEEKVHDSHIKKIIAWYELLKGKVDFNEKDEDDSEGSPAQGDQGKPIVKVHETHAPKADQHKKSATVKLRKKV